TKLSGPSILSIELPELEF
ncbi:MAG: hypothetical protein EZS28_050786, partial [Streblomastix strix]